MLRAQARLSRLVLDNALDYAITTMDADGQFTGWNAGAQRIMGYSEAEVIGRTGDIMFTAEDRAIGRFETELRRAAETGSAVNERWHLRRDGTRFRASGTMMPLRGPDGQLEGFLNILRDRTEAQAEMERRELLLAEMGHRVKNTFAAVQAIAGQTGRHAPSFADFREAFGARLRVLARSHDMLIRGHWEDAPLRQVIEDSLKAYDEEPGRTSVEGPPALLPANRVVMASLVFHELATNAVKHGALSAPGGRVHVAWTVDAGSGAGRAEITWRERGGPAVTPPERRGFGSQLLQQGAAFDGTVRLDFQPEGLECRIVLPLGGRPAEPSNQREGWIKPG